MKLLIIIDMQNDFITGQLGTKQSQKIIKLVTDKIKSFDGKVVYTRDTHGSNYLSTNEGKHLPVVHCIKNTDGWNIEPSVLQAGKNKIFSIIDKNTFGYNGWKLPKVRTIEIIGVCTDICVVANAIILKTLYPETEVIVDSKCCAGTNITNHNKALAVLKSCQIVVQ